MGVVTIASRAWLAHLRGANHDLFLLQHGSFFDNCMSNSEYNLMNQMPISECKFNIQPHYHRLIVHMHKIR